MDKAVKQMVLEPIVSAAENKANMAQVEANWHLGPAKTSVEPKANKPYWAELGKRLQVNEKEARRLFCANCEYFDNTPEKQKQMEAIPLTAIDMDGGGRGYCVKFDFICHNLRVCQAWERKDFELED
tara:strand:- start:416 stop:796 length:381 start_codon:yes stop_codon:yes gene_type:complete